MNNADFDAIAERVRNWGRWGADDQRGTLNLIGPEALKRGAEAVQSGKQFSLGLRFERNGLQGESSGRTNAQLFLHTIEGVLNPGFPRSQYADDTVFMSLQSSTQWDSLSHVHYDGQLYNGCKVCETMTPTGTKKLGIEHLANPGITSRGILLDVARHFGNGAMDASRPITPDVLNAVAAAQGVTIAPGDIVAVRTGAIRAWTERRDRAELLAVQPGLAPACAEWLHDQQVAAVCADNLAVEVMDMDAVASDMTLPLHALCLRDMGMPLGELFNFEELAADCAADGRYGFLLCAPPLGFTGAVGSPVNPIVLK